MPSGLDRPSRATVIASKPIEPTMPADSGTGTPEAVGPRAACTPASPASAPASIMVIIVVRADAHPGGRRGVRVGPDRADREAGGRAVQHPPDADRGQQRQHEAEVQLAALQPREGRVPVDDRRDRVGPPGPLERRGGEQVGQQAGGDVVHHDRHDHLVRAGPGLEPADDAAPDAAADHPAEHGDQQVEHRRQVQGEPDVRGQDRARDRLALGADVEQAGPEGQPDAEPGADQRRGLGGGLGDRPASRRPRPAISAPYALLTFSQRRD